MKRLLNHLKSSFRRIAPPRSPTSAVDVDQLISNIRSSKLTYCGPPKLENLVEACRTIQKDNVRGDFIEAGVALGGSAILLAKLKPSTSTLFLYDVYGLIPPPGEKDGQDSHKRFAEIASGKSPGIGGDVYYGYQEDLYEVVSENLRKYGLVPNSRDLFLIKGIFQDTLHVENPIALAHIDCDWYESVKTCIDRISPRLVAGGIVVFDDYSSYEGCKRAVDEWLGANSDLSVVFHRRSLGVRKSIE